jgi:hypothetical protein
MVALGCDHRHKPLLPTSDIGVGQIMSAFSGLLFFLLAPPTFARAVA